MSATMSVRTRERKNAMRKSMAAVYRQGLGEFLLDDLRRCQWAVEVQGLRADRARTRPVDPPGHAAGVAQAATRNKKSLEGIT
jgi:hypothetical protein